MVGGTERRPSGRHTSRNCPSDKHFVLVTRAIAVWLDALWARFKSLRLRTTFKRQVVPKVVLDPYVRSAASCGVRRTESGYADER
jgi:hypothetical protein